MTHLRFGAPLLGAALLTLSACQSKTPDTEGAAGSTPAETLAVEDGSVAAPAVIGEVTVAEVGSTAPEFVLTDSNGVTHQLSDFRGNPVVLEWINHDCPYVKKHYGAGNMQALQEQYTAEGVVWLSICSSAPNKQGHMSADGWNEASARHESNATAVLLDETGVVGKAYQARTTPHMYVIDAEGNLVYAGAIDSDSSPRPEAIEGAENYVATTLDALLAGNEVEPRTTSPYGCGVKYVN